MGAPGTDAALPSDVTEHSGYDAFLSYSSKDQRLVARIHRFVESFRFGSPRRRVRVYLDRTDIRGGELRGEIRTALERSRALVVCWSIAAADSRWVDREITLFRELHGDRNIVLVLLGDRRTAMPPPERQSAEWRFHDLRSGWTLGVLRPRARLELLRLLAFLTDVDLRKLRNWHLRRTLRHVVIGVAAAIVPPAAVLSVPVEGWTSLELRTDRQQPLYAVAAEVSEGKLWAASRFRGQGPQGFRNYLRTTDDARDSKARARFDAQPRLRLRQRLLPLHLLDPSIALRAPRVDASLFQGREPVGPRLVGEPRSRKLVSVQPLGLTPDEISEARDREADTGIPVPRSTASLVVVHDGEAARAVVVPGLTPDWSDRTPSGDPSSPARGIAVAWVDDGQIWLGVAGRDATSSGGLWHSPDAGRTWAHIKGFASVSSIQVGSIEGRAAEIVVAESYFERWNGGLLEPYPSRVRRMSLPGGAWTDASMPPFGTRAEIELCGILDGRSIVRIDTAIFEHRPRTLLAVLTGSRRSR